MPCLAGTATTDKLPNLVKRSAYQQPFYANVGTTSTYDTTNYPASSRAASVSSLSSSQNGRVISPARWNKALLLPKQTPASDTDFTPLGATAATQDDRRDMAQGPGLDHRRA